MLWPESGAWFPSHTQIPIDVLSPVEDVASPPVSDRSDIRGTSSGWFWDKEFVGDPDNPTYQPAPRLSALVRGRPADDLTGFDLTLARASIGCPRRRVVNHPSGVVLWYRWECQPEGDSPRMIRDAWYVLPPRASPDDGWPTIQAWVWWVIAEDWGTFEQDDLTADALAELAAGRLRTQEVPAGLAGGNEGLSLAPQHEGRPL